MPPASNWDFPRLGTPENILVRANLVTVAMNDGVHLEAGPELRALFGPNSTPALDDVLPYLLDLVVAEAYERSEFLSASDIRIYAVGRLCEAGLNIAAAGILGQKIRTAADESEAELTKQRHARR